MIKYSLSSLPIYKISFVLYSKTSKLRAQEDSKSVLDEYDH